MLYRVCASFSEEKMPEFFKKLTDGSVAEQKPDGREIVASMQRARITSPGQIEWSETCFCEKKDGLLPLAHERVTVYNHFLSQIEAEEIFLEPQISGPSFWSYLANLAIAKL